MKRKRFMALLTTVSVLVGGLAGCGSTPSEQGSAEESSSSVQVQNQEDREEDLSRGGQEVIEEATKAYQEGKTFDRK